MAAGITSICSIFFKIFRPVCEHINMRLYVSKNSPVIKFATLVIFLVAFSGYILLYIYVLSSEAIGTEKDLVCSLTGRVVYDSSYSKNGNHIMTVYITRAENSYGNIVDARGLVTCISKTQTIITCGEKVHLMGELSDSLFICSDIEVSSKGYLNHLRQFLIQTIEKRLLGKNPLNGDYLSAALLLGRAENSNLSVKGYAQESGCLHVLALSGMHLNVIALICQKLFGKKRIGRFLSCFAVTLFVFIAGPRPSLIRALLMFYFTSLKAGPRLVAAFLIQLILFPLTMMNIGSAYGYAAVFALIYVAPYVVHLLNFRIPYPLINVLLTSYTVILFTSPISVALNNTWYWASVFASPVCSVLVTLCMAEGLFSLLFGNMTWLAIANNGTYIALEKVLSFFSRFPASDSRHLWALYAPLVVFICLRLCANWCLFSVSRRKAPKVCTFCNANTNEAPKEQL